MDEECLNDFEISEENFSMVYTETGGFSNEFMEKLLDINFEDIEMLDKNDSEKNDEVEKKKKIPTKKRRKDLIPRIKYKKLDNEDKKEDVDENYDEEEGEVEKLNEKDFEKVVLVDEKFVMENCTIDDITAAKNVVKQLVYEIYDEKLMKGEYLKLNFDKQKEAREKRILKRKKINEKVSEEKVSDSDSTVELSETDEIFDTDVNELLDSFEDETERKVADQKEVLEDDFDNKKEIGVNFDDYEDFEDF